MNDLSGKTVVVIGGTSGIGLETARQARAADAAVIVTGRDEKRLEAVRDELKATAVILDLGDPAGLPAFFAALPDQVDHVLVSGGGPLYVSLAEMDFDQAGRSLQEHLIGTLRIARECATRVRPGGSLTLIGGTGARRPGVGMTLIAIVSAASEAVVRDLAVEIAPVRVNLIAPGFVDTPLSAQILGADLDRRRQELRDTLPIRRVVGPDDVAALALHLMTNSALTGSTYDVDGGQQLTS
jgi:NAD(P)-dependent dehydrogenase (short-subunit alcohol dehydrogenase family)